MRGEPVVLIEFKYFWNDLNSIPYKIIYIIFYNKFKIDKYLYKTIINDLKINQFIPFLIYLFNRYIF